VLRPGLAIVRDESSDGYRLHRMRGDADSGMADAGRGAEQNHALLGSELRCRLCHGLTCLLLAPTFRECHHCFLQPCDGVRAMQRVAAVAASVASGAAVSVALAAA
jgi:hypothetical protein